MRPDPAAAAAEVKRRAIALDLGAPLSIRVNPRARRLLLRIDAAERRIELVLPRGIPAEHGLKFLDAQRGWIAALQLQRSEGVAHQPEVHRTVRVESTTIRASSREPRQGGPDAAGDGLEDL